MSLRSHARYCRMIQAAEPNINIFRNCLLENSKQYGGGRETEEKQKKKKEKFIEQPEY